MVAKLTSVTTAGRPPAPITLNPDHVVELRPRFLMKPNQGSQSGGLLVNYEGSEAELVTGRKVQLLEDYAVAHEALWPKPTPPTPFVGSDSDSVPESIPQANVSNLASALTAAEALQEPPVEPVPEPVKKAPAKKAAPKAANPANKPDDAADISDSVPQAEEATQDQTDAAS